MNNMNYQFWKCQIKIKEILSLMLGTKKKNFAYHINYLHCPGREPGSCLSSAVSGLFEGHEQFPFNIKF